ncbi:hypothetical protein D9619_012128 [Psilocybe cf. subviscida]|uniref:Uncharacterized protein n=1 Tax=Psilocybe cf. subviscida TaxID=2480587 RepID=A0A8H5B7G9_9AGAR|nr:hypothetical protein D9619_012128 [Psilocybe cf. subviscida]
MVTLRNRRIPSLELGRRSDRRYRNQIASTQSVALAVQPALGGHGTVTKKTSKKRRISRALVQFDERTVWLQRTIISQYAVLFKTVAKNKYTLHGRSDFEGLNHVTVEVPVKGVERIGYLYSERDIERRALDKHGGPEGFGKKLARRFKTFVNKAVKTADISKIRPFYYPSSYMPTGGIPNVEIPNVGIFRLNRTGFLNWKTEERVTGRKRMVVGDESSLKRTQHQEARLLKAGTGGTEIFPRPPATGPRNT